MHKPVVSASPAKIIATVAVLQTYIAVKAVKVCVEAAFYAALGKELPPCSCPHHMQSAPRQPEILWRTVLRAA